MSFITESKKVYRQVKILEKENSDHEISMARSELESTADKALAISSMLQSKSDIGNPLEAWVQSKITKAKDYITSVHDYLKYTPGMNESFDLEENTFEKIYQMQQDGKSSEDIAKELKLNPALVKKVLGEQIELKEFTDVQIAALKKEYDPLKGKTITTAQYQQLKNILFKLKDGDLEKLQKQNIPFASTGAGSILRVRKSPVKITSVKVPGLEGMAEENQYVAIHDKKGETSVTANSSYEAAKKASEKFGLKNTAGVTVYLTKKDGKEIIHKATEEAELKEGAKRYKEMSNVGTAKYVVSFHDGIKKHNDGSDFFDVEIFKNKEEKNKFITDLDRKGYRPIKYVDEEVSKEKETEFHKKLDTLVHKTFGKRKDEKAPVKESHFSMGQHVIYKPKSMTPRKAQIVQVTEPQVGAYYKIKISPTLMTYAKPDELELEEACWTGYKQVGLKKKGKRMVPNCVPEERRLYIESIVAVKNKAEKSGMPYSVLKQVYDRGMAAWKGGHRPGATQVQWALARVNSFITKSSGTWGGADSDLAKKVKG